MLDAYGCAWSWSSQTDQWSIYLPQRDGRLSCTWLLFDYIPWRFIHLVLWVNVLPKNFFYTTITVVAAVSTTTIYFVHQLTVMTHWPVSGAFFLLSVNLYQKLVSLPYISGARLFWCQKPASDREHVQFHAGNRPKSWTLINWSVWADDSTAHLFVNKDERWSGVMKVFFNS